MPTYATLRAFPHGAGARLALARPAESRQCVIVRGRPSPVEALVTLPTLTDPAERRARFRQAIAALGQDSIDQRPPPLDGIEPAALIAACRVALGSGLCDDLDWISEGAAGVALYELTAALPQGEERREFGRRVFSRLYGGKAGTFVSVATRMAWGALRQLDSATMRARVSLCFNLPLGGSVNAGPLALSLVLRAPHFESWIHKGARGALPTRRLAALLLESAAREAVRRHHNGDPYPAELLLGAHVRPSYERLLGDREPLVWRHAAVARGLLAAVDPRLREELDLLLDPALSPTEWRRAVVSLVACLTHDPDTTRRQCRSLIQGELVRRHPGLLETFVWGLAPVVEAEPEAAEELLLDLAQTGRREIAEAMMELLREVAIPDFGTAAATMLARKVETTSGVYDAHLLSFLEPHHRRQRQVADDSVHGWVRRAIVAYETQGAQAALEFAREAIERAGQAMGELERPAPGAAHEWLRVLSDLDTAVLERSRLSDLLLLGRSAGDPNAAVPELDALHERLGAWLLTSEQKAQDTDDSEDALSARRRRLVCFLHLLDVQTAEASRASTVQRRICDSLRTLLATLAADPPAAVLRVMCATVARSFDAAIREGVAEAPELLLLVLDHLRDDHLVRSIMEASTDPGLREALEAYTTFLGVAGDADGAASLPNIAKGFLDFSRGVARHGSRSGEALRQALLRTGRALEVLATARGMTQLAAAENRKNPVDELEEQIDVVRRLARMSARRVLAARPRSESAYGLRTGSPAAMLEHAVGAGQALDPEVFAGTIQALTLDIAPAIGSAVARVLARVPSLPITPPSDVTVIPMKPRRGALPDWLMPRRTIGAFYVVSALGAGGVSSVFVAKRIEERRDPNADVYALKVPEYDPSTARSLSEHEFMDLFRDEAGALLSLPRHTNLARFVNFDAAAKPKPILVMELIRGQSLEKLIKNGLFTLPQALAHLDGVLGGLAAMHSVGVAHLDIKPSNVILRDEHTPALVDFGLSGRQLRPGCGTLEYCAPEVLGVIPEGVAPPAVAADVYAFGCLAYEVLTGSLLFDADEETALMSQHISHDGWPEPLQNLASTPELHDLAVLIGSCIRRDPRLRPQAKDLRTTLATIAAELQQSHLAWPLPVRHDVRTSRAM